MECHECANLLNEYMDNELDNEMGRKIEEHLHICRSCQNTWQELQEAVFLYRHHVTAVTVSEGFSERVMTSLVASNYRKYVTAPLATVGVSLLVIFSLACIFLSPVIYPMLRMLFRVTMQLLSLPAVMLSAFPLLLYAGLLVLVAVFLTLTWATRRAILS